MRREDHEAYMKQQRLGFEQQIRELKATHAKAMECAQHATAAMQRVVDQYGDDLNTLDRRMWRYYKALQALGVDPGRLWDDPPDDLSEDAYITAALSSHETETAFVGGRAYTVEHALPGCTCEYGECWDQWVVGEQGRIEQLEEAANYRYEHMPWETLHTRNPYEV